MHKIALAADERGELEAAMRRRRGGPVWPHSTHDIHDIHDTHYLHHTHFIHTST